MRANTVEATSKFSPEATSHSPSWEWSVMRACGGPNQKSAFIISTLRNTAVEDPTLEQLRVALLPSAVQAAVLVSQELATTFKNTDAKTFTALVLKTAPNDSLLHTLDRPEAERRVSAFMRSFQALRPVADESSSEANRKQNQRSGIFGAPKLAAVTPEGATLPVKAVDPKQAYISKASWIDGLTGQIAKQNVLTDAACLVGTVISADMVFKTTAMALTDGQVTDEAMKAAVLLFSLEFAAINALFTPLGAKLMDYITPQEGEVDLIFRKVSNETIQNTAKLLVGLVALSFIAYDMGSSWVYLPAYMRVTGGSSVLAQIGRVILAAGGTFGLPLFASKLVVDAEETAGVIWRRLTSRFQHHDEE